MLGKHGIHTPQILSGIGTGDQLCQRNRLAGGVTASGGPAQRCHTAAAAQCLADILAEGADIGALGTAYPQVNAVSFHTEQCQFVDGDRTGLPFDFPAFSCQIAKLLPIYLEGGVHWRDLQDLPAKTGKHFFQHGAGHERILFRQNRAGNILCVGGDSQPQHGFIGFFCMFKKLYSPGGASYKYRQDSGGHGVQCAAVADPPGLKHTPQFCGHVLTGPALRLIYDYDSIHSLSLSCRAHSICARKLFYQFLMGGYGIRPPTLYKGHSVLERFYRFGHGHLHACTGGAFMAASAELGTDSGSVIAGHCPDGELDLAGAFLPDSGGDLYAFYGTGEAGDIF